MYAKHEVSISYGSKVIANVKADNRQTNRQDKNKMPPIIRSEGIKSYHTLPRRTHDWKVAGSNLLQANHMQAIGWTRLRTLLKDDVLGACWYLKLILQPACTSIWLEKERDMTKTLTPTENSITIDNTKTPLKKKTLTPTENSTTKLQHKNATKIIW